MARVEYETKQEFYCGFCGNKFDITEVKVNGLGQKRCPRDSTLLRASPRGKNKHNVVTLRESQ
jgi:hypothetical protein